MKRGLKAVIVGVVVFVGLNVGFFVVPGMVISILKPLDFIINWLIGGVPYRQIFGSEYRQFVSLSILFSLIITIISYFIIPGKNEK